MFLPPQVIKNIVTETNKYAREVIDSKKEWMDSHPKSRYYKWKPVDECTIRRYFAICFEMGLTVRKNAETYWSTRKSKHIGFFSDAMSRDLYCLVRRFLHVNDSQKEKKRGEDGFDPWHKVRPFLDSCNKLFKAHYTPQQTLSYDESLVAMKNRIVYLQYMPDKRHARFGIKKFELCEASSGYMYHVDLYSSKDFFATGAKEGLGHKVIMNAMKESGVLNKGYHLITDNFYTKIPLATALLDQKTYLSGTIRANSKFLPKNLMNAKLNVNDPLYFRKGEILACGFKEKPKRKPVYLVSTFVHADNVTYENRKGLITKPKVIHDYNIGMGGVDLCDKKIYHYASERRTNRYWVKIFMNMLDMCVLNAYIIYVQNTDKPIARFDFITSIIEHYVYGVPPQGATPLRKCLTPPTSPAGSATGFLHEYQRIPGSLQRFCAVCPRRARHWCPGCNCGIHEDCWPQLEHFWRAKGQPKKRGRVDL